MCSNDSMPSPRFVCSLNHSYVELGKHQFLPGYCILFAKEKYEHLTDMPFSVREEYLMEMTLVGEAMQEVLPCLRINYSLLGNTYPAVHAHLFPRYAWEEENKRKTDVHRYGEDFLLSPAYAFSLEKHQEIKEKLAQKILEKFDHWKKSQKQKKIHLYFLRHGQTYFNVFSRLQGWANSPLTEKGRNVAQTSGQAFKKLNFDFVYSSDLPRAVETAKLFLAENEGLIPQIKEMPSLREVGFGYYEGLENKKVWALAEEKVRKDFSLSEDATVTEAMKLDALSQLDPAQRAESFSVFETRLKKGLQEIVCEIEEATSQWKQKEISVLIVSHSSAIQTLLQAMDKNFQASTSLENGALSLLAYEAGQYKVVFYNHLNREEPKDEIL